MGQIFFGSPARTHYILFMANVTGGSMAAHRCSCYFSGRVQGVGFRYTAKNIAIRHNVTGYIKNLNDGRVEMVLEGPDEELDQVVESIKGRMSGYIRQVDRSLCPATGEFAQFYIRH